MERMFLWGGCQGPARFWSHFLVKKILIAYSQASSILSPTLLYYRSKITYWTITVSSFHCFLLLSDYLMDVAVLFYHVLLFMHKP